MNRDDLVSLHKCLCSEASNLLAKKNAAYATPDEAFGNLAVIEAVTAGRLSCEQGIVIRMSDKLTRLWNLLADESIDDLGESIKDTLLDLINYAVLLQARRSDD